jgi:superfamily I DNA and RNA helicase
MDSGIEELQNVRDQGYRLAFNVPTTEQLEKMRRIHRDKSDAEIAKQRDVLKNLFELVNMAESGDLLVDAIPEDLKKRLEVLFEPADERQ